MTQLDLPTSGKKPRGIPLWMALLAFLCFALLGVGALIFTVYYIRSDNARFQRALEAQQAEKLQHEVERVKAAENDRVTLARNLQDQVMGQIAVATNDLMQLLTGIDEVRATAAALRTNDAGRKIALHPSLVPLARRLFQVDLARLATEQEIGTQLEAVRRVGLQVAENRGTAYSPSQALTQSAQQSVAWSSEGNLKLKAVKDLLKSLVQDSEVIFTRATLTTNSPTLVTAIEQLNQQETAALTQIEEKTAAVARTNAAQIEAEARIQELIAKADALFKQRMAEADKIRADADRYAEDKRRQIAEEKKAKELEDERREAQLRLAASNNVVRIAQTNAEARDVVLRQKASDPMVQAKLAPFITPGYLQFGGYSTELLPLSLSGLQSFGALQTDAHGWSQLVRVASDAGDKKRPRWHMNYSLFIRKDKEREQVVEAQALLIELGQVLVEMGKLQP